MNLLLKTLIDLKEPAILIRLFIPFAAGLIVVSLLGYGLFGIFLTSDFITQNPMVQNFNHWEQQAENSIGAIPIVGGIILWFLGFIVAVIAGILGIILGSYLILLFAMIITGFLTETIIKAVHDKHYLHIEYTGHGSTAGTIWKIVKFGLLILLLFIITLPLLFIPLINVVWFWLLGFLFFRYSIVLDVGQVILPEALFNKLRGLTNWQPTSALAILLLLSMFPIISFFAPVLAVIALSHYYFDQLSLKPTINPKHEALRSL
jgi:hypothetical protein